MGESFVLGVCDFYEGRLTDVSLEQVEDRLRRIAGLGAKTVRLLLPWHEVQPEIRSVPDSVLRWLESYLEKAKASALQVVPVFFCGRLDEANWLPHWMCETPQLDPKPLDLYRERDLIRAQQLQIDVVVAAFADHDAVLAWDLGRETSTLVPVPDPDAARSRLLWLLESLKRRDEVHAVTLTLSQIDLEEDRGMRPGGLAVELEFLSLRVNPGETSRVVQGNDAAGFYCALTQRLSGKPVLLSELVMQNDEETSEKIDALLEDVEQSGVLGAVAWSDTGALGAEAAESFRRFAVSRQRRVDAPSRRLIDEPSYYADPEAGLRVAFEEYRKERSLSEKSHPPGLLDP